MTIETTACPMAEYHGNPHRYCQCGWMQSEGLLIVDMDAVTLRDVYTLLLDVRATQAQHSEILQNAASMLQSIASEVGPIVEKIQNSALMKMFR